MMEELERSITNINKKKKYYTSHHKRSSEAWEVISLEINHHCIFM
jgi:hypothetical protein